MRPLLLVLLLGLFCVTSCSRERAVSARPDDGVRQAPLSAFSISGDAQLTGGECMRMNLPDYPGKTVVAYVIPNATAMTRRILVVVDSAGTLARYSDVRVGADAISLDVDFVRDRGMVAQTGVARIARAPANEIFDATNLGRPRNTAALVRRACGV